MMTACNHLFDVGKRRNERRLLDDGLCAKAELVVFIGTPTVSVMMLINCKNVIHTLIDRAKHNLRWERNRMTNEIRIGNGIRQLIFVVVSMTVEDAIGTKEKSGIGIVGRNEMVDGDIRVTVFLNRKWGIGWRRVELTVFIET